MTNAPAKPGACVVRVVAGVWVRCPGTSSSSFARWFLFCCRACACIPFLRVRVRDNCLYREAEKMVDRMKFFFGFSYARIYSFDFLYLNLFACVSLEVLVAVLRSKFDLSCKSKLIWKIAAKYLSCAVICAVGAVNSI